MKIVILDAYALNPGDLSWERMESLGETVIWDRTEEKDILSRSRGAQILITNKTPLSKETIEQLPELKYIGVLATGYNVVDIQAASERNIPVTNIPTYGTDSVAQMVFAHILHLTQHVAEHSESVKEGDWTNCPDFCYWNYPMIELAGKTIGIVGFGRIGRKVADIANVFGMKVLAYDAFADSMTSTVATFVDLDTLFSQSDVVSLHCPLFPETEGIVNERNLSMMKRSAFLINTSRGPLVNEEDLTKALNEGTIAAAGLDVVSTEPIKSDNPLPGAKNCFITPHIAWATFDARKRLLDTAVDNVEAFLKMEPVNVVNM
ncbi:MAG: D-2-hydroxyacid dehydrogenase [Spirochaetaceae bacterium JB067]